MSLHADAIKEIASLKATATSPIILDQYKTALHKGNGDLHIETTQERPVSARAFGIRAVIDWVQNYYTENMNDRACPCEVYYSRHGVRAFVTADHRDSITMLFTKSPAFALLETWAGKTENLKQETLYRHLKCTFYGCVDPTLEAMVKNVKWNYGDTGDAAVSRGKVSVNKSLIRDFSGIDKLADSEYVDFTVPVFQELPKATAKIRCYIDLDATNQTFIVTPCGGEIENAYREAEDAMRMQIDAAQKSWGDGCQPIMPLQGACNADNIQALKMV